MQAEFFVQAALEEQIAAARSDHRVRPDVDPQLSALAVLGATNWVYRWYRPTGPGVRSRSPTT